MKSDESITDSPLSKSLSASLRVRLNEFIQAAQPQFPKIAGGMTPTAELLSGPPPDLFRASAQVLRAQRGQDVGKPTRKRFFEEAEPPQIWALMEAIPVAVNHEAQRTSGRSVGYALSDLERHLNEILAEEDAGVRMREGRMVPTVSSDTEALRRVLLLDDEEVAGCRQGDPQVNMVASTVQERLGKPGQTLVDYGAGLGRVLAGLGTAHLFKQATYVAVDEPPPEVLGPVAATLGATAEIMGREQFLAGGTTADAIMVVNTLHHVPFDDIPRQFSRLFGMLALDGFLLVHEMGKLHDPEQRNVPWRIEDVQVLFGQGGFSVNSRTTQSRGKKIPLCNVIIKVNDKDGSEESLTRGTEMAWEQMKARTLDEIRELYSSRDPDRESELQHALIINANLDLNRPS